LDFEDYTMSINMTGQTLLVKQGWPRDGSGQYVGSNPNTSDTSGGTPALAWSAPSGLVEGETLTITTDGTNPFGTTGPNFILLIDTYNAQGTYVSAVDDMEVGTGVTLDTFAYGSGFELENTDKLGPAIKMGCGGTFAQAQNGLTAPNRIWLDFPAHPRMFESRATYWSATNQANAASALDSNCTWQLKNVWKLADRSYSGEDTDFFITGEGYNFNNGSLAFKAGSPVVSSNTVSTIYFGGNKTNNTNDTYQRPFTDPFFHEALSDQKNYDGTTANNVVEYRSTRAGVGVVNQTTRTDLVLADSNGPTRVINSLSYPGFISGFSVDENANFHEADLYFANGEGAACRAVISDHSDYFQSTKYAAMKPLSWGNTSLSFKFRSGIFQGNLSGCYVNIIGIDNTQIGSIAL